MHIQFLRQTKDLSSNDTWQWLRRECQKVMIIVFKSIHFRCIRYNLVSHQYKLVFFYKLQVEKEIILKISGRFS